MSDQQPTKAPFFVAAMLEMGRNMGYITRHNLVMAVAGDKRKAGEVVTPLVQAGLVKNVENGNGLELTLAGEAWIENNRDAMATLVVSRAVKSACVSVFDLGSPRNLPKRQKGN